MAFKHPIVIEKTMNFDDMEHLACQLRQGCETTRAFMIEGFVPLAFSIVKRFLNEFPGTTTDPDDLSSEAFVAIIEALDVIATSDAPVTDNVVAYVSTAITNRLCDVGRANQKRVTTKGLGWAIDVPYYDSEADEVLEEVMSMCRTERQRSIIRLRAENRTDLEIASLLNVSEKTCLRERQAIEQRYNNAQ